MEMVLFTGMQASGKSEFYKRVFYKSHVRINLDMLRTRSREGILLDACIRAKQPFVVDNTNPTGQDRRRYIELAKTAGFAVRGYYFRSSIAECIARNALRTGRECIPRQALLATHAKLELPRRDEGFDSLFYVYIKEDGSFAQEEFTDEI